MKKILFALFAFASVVLFASDSEKELAKKLYGRIKIVNGSDDYPDYKVRIVPYGSYKEDLRVKIVDSTPSRTGEWQIVDEGWHFEIRFVTEGEDISICFVQDYPGLTP